MKNWWEQQGDRTRAQLIVCGFMLAMAIILFLATFFTTKDLASVYRSYALVYFCIAAWGFALSRRLSHL